jgi:hypothetical protein
MSRFFWLKEKQFLSHYEQIPLELIVYIYSCNFNISSRLLKYVICLTHALKKQ